MRGTGVWWGSGGRRSSLGGRKGAFYLVLDSFLPEIHLILQIRSGHAVGQLISGIDAQDLLCPSDYQGGWGWLHWQKWNRTCQYPSPCLQAGLPLPHPLPLPPNSENTPEKAKWLWCLLSTYYASRALKSFYFSFAVTLGGRHHYSQHSEGQTVK